MNLSKFQLNKINKINKITKVALFFDESNLFITNLFQINVEYFKENLK